MSASKINKALGKASRYFCNQIVEKGQRNMYQEAKKPKQYETVEITPKEKIFKNQEIEVFFEGYKEDLSDLRLKVYVNNAMKYVSQAGAFIITTVQVPKIVRKGWFFTTIFYERTYLKFKHQSEFERFIRFTQELRDCARVQDMYREQCVIYAKKIMKVQQPKEYE